MSFKRVILSGLLVVRFPCSVLAGDGISAHNLFQSLIGRPDSSKFYLGMFTQHINPNSQKKDNNVNNIVGVNYNGLFLGGFSNSYGKLTVGFGMQRDWHESDIGQSHWHYALGYRLGAMIGYDNRLCHYCGDLPAVPFIIPYLHLSYKRVGVEVQYAYVLVSASFFYRFG